MDKPLRYTWDIYTSQFEKYFSTNVIYHIAITSSTFIGH